MKAPTSMALRDNDRITSFLLNHADFGGSAPIGEWRFLVALLDRAITDLRDKNVVVRNSARAWIAFSGPRILGFEEVCDFLGIDSDWARGVLRKEGYIGGVEDMRLAA